MSVEIRWVSSGSDTFIQDDIDIAVCADERVEQLQVHRKVYSWCTVASLAHLATVPHTVADLRQRGGPVDHVARRALAHRLVGYALIVAENRRVPTA